MTGFWGPRAWRWPVCCFLNLDEERALLRYQQPRLEIRERVDRNF